MHLDTDVSLAEPSVKAVGLVMVTMAAMKHHDQSSVERKGFIWLAFPHCCSALKKVRTGTQGRNLKAGSDAEAMEGAGYWFALHSVHSLLS